jgi:alcohol dehydrogenase class IV
VTVARLVTDRPDATAADAVAWFHDLVSELGIPRLRTYGIADGHVEDLVEKAAKASSMKGNPLELTRGELATALRQAL